MECDNKMTFEECELAILRSVIDKSKEKKGEKINSPEIKMIISIVENFIKDKKLLCYGGTAINNILPEKDRFYNKNIELPDYDFFSPNALADAKELADIYNNKGFTEVEAKSGVHYGTFKVFVSFIPVADITLINKHLFHAVKKDSIINNGIHYCPPNYLRMSMYLELSRPDGDTSRWEKVLKRLSLLNKNYPIENKCNSIKIQRHMDSKKIDSAKLYDVLKRHFIKKNAVFFGGYANALYSKHSKHKGLKQQISEIPDFDLLSENPKDIITSSIDNLQKKGYNASYEKHKGIGEIIAPHYELIVNDDTVAFVYEPLACHSYNVVNNEKIKIATIDTMLSFYLAFLYADRGYYEKDRLLCMAKNLFEVQQKNKLEQTGILKRFSLECIGKQPTLESMRALKAEMYKKLKNKRQSNEYNMWFLRYVPKEYRVIQNKIKSKSKRKRKDRFRAHITRSTRKKYNDNTATRNNNNYNRKPKKSRKSNKNNNKPYSHFGALEL